MSQSVRVIVALVCVWVALFGPPSTTKNPPPSPAVEVPDVRLQEVVADVGKALRKADGFDRAVWASTWTEAAKLVDGDRLDGTFVTFSDSLGLRTYQMVVLDIAWRRLANASGKYEGLQQAVEEAFTAVVGNEIVPWTPELQGRVVDLYKALAWAGVSRG